MYSICKLCKNSVKRIPLLTSGNSHICDEAHSVHTNKYHARNITEKKSKLEQREAGVREQRLSVWCSKSSDHGLQGP